MRVKAYAIDLVLVVLAAAAVVFMGLTFFTRQDTPHPMSGASPTGDALLGKKEPTIQALAPHGSVAAVALADQPAYELAVVFRTDCPYCEQTADTWSSLAEGVRRQHGRIVAVTPNATGSAQAWLRRHSLRVDKLIVPVDANDLVTKWSVTSVPLTLVLDPSGAIRFTHYGVLRSQDAKAALEALVTPPPNS